MDKLNPFARPVRIRTLEVSGLTALFSSVVLLTPRSPAGQAPERTKCIKADQPSAEKTAPAEATKNTVFPALRKNAARNSNERREERGKLSDESRQYLSWSGRGVFSAPRREGEFRHFFASRQRFSLALSFAALAKERAERKYERSNKPFFLGRFQFNLPLKHNPRRQLEALVSLTLLQPFDDD